MNIVIVIFFLIISDILLPEGSIKQYVKVILGLFVVLVVIKPMIEIKRIDYDFQDTYKETASFLEDNQVGEDYQVLNTYSREKAIDIYENNIRKMILNTIVQDDSINKEYIYVELDIEKDYLSSDFGSLRQVIVSMPDNLNNKKVDNIRKIKIQRDKNVIYKDKEEYNFNDKTSIEELRNKLSKLLYINKENIQINLTIDKNGGESM